MNKKGYFLIIIFLCTISGLAAQDGAFAFEQRITIGHFSSYWEDDIGILEAGYDFVIPLLKITPAYTMFDVGVGLSGIFAFDKTLDPRKPVVGFSLNGSARIYSPYFKNNRLFLEGVGSLVVYTKEYPANGTILNFGWHVGGGWEYKTGGGTKLFATVRWFHTSNNNIWGKDRNPSINAIGLSAGVQF